MTSARFFILVCVSRENPRSAKMRERGQAFFSDSSSRFMNSSPVMVSFSSR